MKNMLYYPYQSMQMNMYNLHTCTCHIHVFRIHTFLDVIILLKYLSLNRLILTVGINTVSLVVFEDVMIVRSHASHPLLT